MFIGSLYNEETVYTYHKRGTKLPMFPNLYKESVEDGFISIDKGKIFKDQEVGFSAEYLLDLGVDICFKLGGEGFVDHVLLNQGEYSAFSAAQIIKESENGETGLIGKYYAQTGGIVRNGEVKIDIGENISDTDSLIIRIHGAGNNFVIRHLGIYGAKFSNDTLFPLPHYRKTERGKPPFIFDNSAYILASEGDEDIIFSAGFLKEKLKEIFKIDVKLTLDSTSGKKITFKRYEDNEPLFGEEDAFSLNVDELGISIKANGRRGFLYGAEALLSLIDNNRVLSTLIDDKPAKEFRAMHIYSLPERKDLEFFKRFIKYMVVPLRYNILVMEVCGGMRYESHPEINEKWLEACNNYKAGKGPFPPHCGCVMHGTIYEKSEVAELVEYIKQFGIEIIPEVQALGHVQYITNAYPEIGEVRTAKKAEKNSDLAVADAIPDEFSPHCYCLSNEKSYEIIFDLADEIIETFKPERYVNMGHDEVTEIGVCPLCEKRNPADLLAEHVNRTHGYLQKYGLKMMVWADMFQNVKGEGTPYLNLSTVPAVDKIPKDVLMLDFIWYFYLNADIEDHLLSNDFNVIVGNLYSSHYPRYEKRIKKPGMLGGMISIWVDTNEYQMATLGKFYDFVYTSNMLWDDKYSSSMRLSYKECVKNKLPMFRSLIRGEKESFEGRILDISKAYTHEKLPGICNIFKDFGIRGVCEISKEKELIIPVDNTYSALSFLHAADKNERRIAWKPLTVVGNYEICYEDGTKEGISVEYGGNICEIKRGYAEPLPYPYYRHQGYIGTYLADPAICAKTDDGDFATIYKYTWKNPHPQKKIKHIIASGDKNTDVKVLLFSLSGI